jgi:hypothetical protein
MACGLGTLFQHPICGGVLLRSFRGGNQGVGADGNLLVGGGNHFHDFISTLRRSFGSLIASVYN